MNGRYGVYVFKPWMKIKEPLCQISSEVYGFIEISVEDCITITKFQIFSLRFKTADLGYETN